MVLLAVEDVGTQRFRIEIHRNGRQTFQRDRHAHDGPFAAVKRLPQREVIDMIKLHACLNEHPDDLREGFLGVDGGMGSGSDEGSVHGGRK